MSQNTLAGITCANSVTRNALTGTAFPHMVTPNALTGAVVRNSGLRFGLRFECPEKAAFSKVRTSTKTVVKRTRLLCTKLPKIDPVYHPLLRVCSHIFPIIPMLDSGKLFEVACPMHCWTSNRSSSKRLPLQHPAYPSLMGGARDVASKFPMLRSAVFTPCLYVKCLAFFGRADPRCAEFRATDPSNKSRLERQPSSKQCETKCADRRSTVKHLDAKCADRNSVSTHSEANWLQAKQFQTV